MPSEESWTTRGGLEALCAASAALLWLARIRYRVSLHANNRRGRDLDLEPDVGRAGTSVNNTSQLVFLGSGSSAGTPFAACVLGSIPEYPKGGCPVCADALKHGHASKNHRLNPSLLIRYRAKNALADDRPRDIVIDVGKTFREAALRFFPQFGVTGIDAVVISHEHADAFHGMDELRTVQRRRTLGSGDPDPTKPPTEPAGAKETQKKRKHWLSSLLMPIHVYASDSCMQQIRQVYSYLWPREADASDAPEIKRYVAQLTFTPFRNEIGASFEVEGLRFSPLPVEHGSDFISAGFSFGETDWVVYISDVSAIPKATMQAILERRARQGISLLVLDTLHRVRAPHRPPVHFDLFEALEVARQLRPDLCLLVGIAHELDHEALVQELDEIYRREGVRVLPAYDGMSLDLRL